MAFRTEDWLNPVLDPNTGEPTGSYTFDPYESDYQPAVNEINIYNENLYSDANESYNTGADVAYGSADDIVYGTGEDSRLIDDTVVDFLNRGVEDTNVDIDQIDEEAKEILGRHVGETAEEVVIQDNIIIQYYTDLAGGVADSINHVIMAVMEALEKTLREAVISLEILLHIDLTDIKKLIRWLPEAVWTYFDRFLFEERTVEP